MSSHKILIFLILSCLTGNVFGEEASSSFRLQLRKTSADDTINLSDCSGKSMGLKDSSEWGKTHLFAGSDYKTHLTNEWKQFSVSFTPNQDGKVRIVLQAISKNNDIAFDSITSDDVEIPNGSFEDVSIEGKLKYIRDYETSALTKGKTTAKEGENYIKLSHDKRFSFIIDLKANKPVTISFYAKKVKAKLINI